MVWHEQTNVSQFFFLLLKIKQITSSLEWINLKTSNICNVRNINRYNQIQLMRTHAKYLDRSWLEKVKQGYSCLKWTEVSFSSYCLKSNKITSSLQWLNCQKQKKRQHLQCKKYWHNQIQLTRTYAKKTGIQPSEINKQ